MLVGYLMRPRSDSVANWDCYELETALKPLDLVTTNRVWLVRLDCPT